MNLMSCIIIIAAPWAPCVVDVCCITDVIFIICQEFLELVVGTTSDLPLPPPRAAAKLLKEQALKAVQEWNAKYGKAYKKLALGFGFLKYNKMVSLHRL